MRPRRDTLYKQLFSHPEIVRDLVSGFLDAPWAEALRAGLFERVNASYASERGQARHDDVVWRVQIGGEWVYVYILLEFQARPDKWMALRMQVYIGLLYQDLVAQHKLSKHGKLPPVLPIVLYHGRRPWSSATELAQLMLPPPEGLESFQASQKYMLIDHHHDDLHGDIVSLLFRLLRAGSDDELTAAANAFAGRARHPELAAARDSLTRWLRITLQDDFDEADINLEGGGAMRSERKYKFENVFTDEFFDRLLQPGEACRLEGMQQGLQDGLRQGVQQGLQDGLQQGVQQGERRALQTLLNDLLTGEVVSAEVSARIAEADTVQLNFWVRALFSGASPRQLFAEG